MKDWIKQILRENLEEIKTIEKPKFGSGVEHNIYSSPKNPNVLFKVVERETVLKWSTVFKSNPKLFPKVFRIGALRDGKYYVEIEKLNTQKVVDEWNRMELALEEVGYVDLDVFDATLNQVFIDLILGYLSIDKILKSLEHNKEMYSLVKKWVFFLTKVYKYIKKFGYNGLDTHRYNFAYDSSGNIKAIDI